jgi:hypothetical protein
MGGLRTFDAPASDSSFDLAGATGHSHRAGFSISGARRGLKVRRSAGLLDFFPVDVKAERNAFAKQEHASSFDRLRTSPDWVIAMLLDSKTKRHFGFTQMAQVHFLRLVEWLKWFFAGARTPEKLWPGSAETLVKEMRAALRILKIPTGTFSLGSFRAGGTNKNCRKRTCRYYAFKEGGKSRARCSTMCSSAWLRLGKQSYRPLRAQECRARLLSSWHCRDLQKQLYDDCDFDDVSPPPGRRRGHPMVPRRGDFFGTTSLGL